MPKTLAVALIALAAALPAAAQERQYDFATDDLGNLHRVDLEGRTASLVGRVRVPLEGGGAESPVLTDLAATPDGYLYGISFGVLYLINLSAPAQSRRIGSHGLSGANAMTVTPEGTLLITTTGGGVHEVDRETGRTTPIGDLGSGYTSSGDIELVGEEVFCTVKDALGRERLVTLDLETGRAESVGLLQDGQGQPVYNVYGLICRRGVLYGLTARGDVLRIDTETGRCAPVLRTDTTWWGATGYLRL